MATYVFVRLFYEGKTEPLGDDLQVSPIPRNVATLKTEVIPDYPHPNLVFVYGRGQNYPAEGEARLPVRSSLPIADSNDAEDKLAPLRVVVPAPTEQPQTNARMRQEEQPNEGDQRSKPVWVLQEGEVVERWQAFEENPNNLPTEPFPTTTDRRNRFELKNQFLMRTCFYDFEALLWAASKEAAEGKRNAAMSVLGAKGAGKSVFFRFFCWKHCSTRLIIYVPDGGTNMNEIYRKLMIGLIFGLQCVRGRTEEEEAARASFLVEARSRPLTGSISEFRSLWDNWSIKYKNLCARSFVLIDQLQRSGDVFDNLSSDTISCAGYVLISSTGMLNHHAVRSVYEKMVYFYPVQPGELGTLDPNDKLKDQEVTTMLQALSLLDGPHSRQSYGELNIQSARKHYRDLEEKKDPKLLTMLLAVVQAAESDEPIDGYIWKEVIDMNYMMLTEDCKVRADKAYLRELKRLLVREKVAYKDLLLRLLSDQEIVDRVGNGALGVHLEELLDIIWQDTKRIAWEYKRDLKRANTKSTRNNAGSSTVEIRGEAFENIQSIDFDGDAPEEEKLLGVNWDKPVYFKPKKTNYAGFDMFVLKKVYGSYYMYAIQVTVSNAAEHGVEKFDDTHMTLWMNLLSTHLPAIPVNWVFYMLTPEDNPPATCPASSFDHVPIYQVGFHRLTSNGEAAIQVVNAFPDLLKTKRQRQKEVKRRRCSDHSNY